MAEAPWFEVDLTPERRALLEILDEVWCSALDVSNSPDFRDADGELNEDAYIRYQRNVYRRAADKIEESRP